MPTYWKPPSLTECQPSTALQHGKAKTPIRVRAQERDKRVLLEVNNEGSPIASGTLAAIFEPMVSHGQPDNNSTHLGMGLYIAREIVNAHGGSLSVPSTKDTGTTFTVVLPRHAVSVKGA